MIESTGYHQKRSMIRGNYGKFPNFITRKYSNPVNISKKSIMFGPIITVELVAARKGYFQFLFYWSKKNTLLL